MNISVSWPPIVLPKSQFLGFFFDMCKNMNTICATISILRNWLFSDRQRFIHWLRRSCHWSSSDESRNHTRITMRRHKACNRVRHCIKQYLTIIELAMWLVGRVCGNQLLERLMSPSPKSQVMFAPAFSWIGDFFVQWADAAELCTHAVAPSRGVPACYI